MNEVEAIINGDEFIFEEVYHQHHEKLYFFLLRYLRSPQDTEEVVQQTFIKLWSHRKSLSPKLPVSQQLFQIAKSCLIDHFRVESREKKRKAQYTAFINDSQAVAPDTATELNEMVELAIDRLPPARKYIFTLSRRENLTHKEIADHLSLSVKTVESHIYKALKQLRDSLAHFFLF
jgi:RNA polymerase sigma-70 factor (ECF subfamily)